MRKIKLSKEEQDILNDFEKGKFKRIANFKKRKEELMIMAKNFLEKKKIKI